MTIDKKQHKGVDAGDSVVYNRGMEPTTLGQVICSLMVGGMAAAFLFFCWCLCATDPHNK